MKGVILAAGKGTRMLPLTLRRPKPLVPVMDRPMLAHIISGARDAGIDHLCVVIDYLGDMIQAAFGTGEELGVRIEYVQQGDARGTGGATLKAREFVGDEPFFLCWGDILVPPHTYSGLLCRWHNTTDDALLTVNWVDDPWAGAAVYVKDGHVEKIVEKPAPGTSTTNYNNAGLFVFTPELFSVLEHTSPNETTGEVYVPDAVQHMLSQGRRIGAYPLPQGDYWSDVASPQAAILLSGEMIVHHCAQGVIRTEDAFVAPGAELRPPVYIGPGCRIENGAEVGPNVALLEAVHVGEKARLHHVMSFGVNTVGAEATVKWGIIEEGVIVEPGAVVSGQTEQPAVLCCTEGA